MTASRLAGRALSTLLHRYRQHARGLTLGARGLVLRDGEASVEVLLIRHTYAPGFQLPGGGVEPGEGAPDAMRRELWEEARVRLGDAEPELLGLYHNGPKWPRDHVACYVVRDYAQPEAPRPSREIAEHVWAPVDALPDGIQSSARQRIAEGVSGAPRIGTWVPPRPA